MVSCALLGGAAAGLSLLAGAWAAGLFLFALSSALLITATQLALHLRARKSGVAQPGLAAG